MTIDEARRQAFIDTDYIIHDDPPLVLHVAEQHDGLRLLMMSFEVESAAFLTAWNPGAEAASEDDNYAAQAALLDEIEQRRLNYFVGCGQHPVSGWYEDSYLVLGISQPEATLLAGQFDQAGYLWIPPSAIPELIILEEASD